MADKDDVYDRDVPTGTVTLRKTAGSTDTSETDKQKFKGFTAGAARPSSAPMSDFPKQNQGEDPAAYAGRLRAYRERKASAIK